MIGEDRGRYLFRSLLCTFLIVSFSLTPAPPRKPLSTSPAKPVSGASRLQRKPQQAASRLPAGGRAGGGGGGVQKAAGGGASASELRAAEEEIKRLNTQVGPHIWSSVRTLLCVKQSTFVFCICHILSPLSPSHPPLCSMACITGPFLPRVLRCVP